MEKKTDNNEVFTKAENGAFLTPAEAEEYRQEANRLQGLLNMKQSSGVNGPVAHVIGRSSNAWDQSLTIDLGSPLPTSGLIDYVTRVTYGEGEDSETRIVQQTHRAVQFGK